MKPLLLFSLALSFFIHSLAQYPETSIHKMATDYLKKSKNQKTAGWVMLSGGAIATAIGLAVIASGKNRKKAAAAVSFKMENATIIQQWIVCISRYPAIALQFRL